MAKKNMRIEKDSMGDVKVPAEAYYGAQTQRAIDNFTISQLQLSKSFIYSLAIIKRSAAIVNCRLKKINNKHSKAIIKACDEILDGKYIDEYVIDIFQTGSGTSTNMNMNEVISNIAAEKSGSNRGNKSKDPRESPIHQKKVLIYIDWSNKKDALRRL